MNIGCAITTRRGAPADTLSNDHECDHCDGSKRGAQAGHRNSFRQHRLISPGFPTELRTMGDLAHARRATPPGRALQYAPERCIPSWPSPLFYLWADKWRADRAEVMGTRTRHRTTAAGPAAPSGTVLSHRQYISRLRESLSMRPSHAAIRWVVEPQQRDLLRSSCLTARLLGCRRE